ncbi:hypothetical protein ZIOFF_042788 [Zingiber officinale]|uniref:NAC domain-containing protein n=1 Tax=Zingiber officinale TaxID=94328 RepID=A0A8J5G2A4_ZINOF|nr:hypothetical protein ZIOFF_042788 [Zingiber officinale]
MAEQEEIKGVQVTPEKAAGEAEPDAVELTAPAGWTKKLLIAILSLGTWLFLWCVHSRLPPGFRFRFTDDELVGYYLKRKVDGLSFELEIIPVVELYKYEPWELPDDSHLRRE